MRTYVAAEDKIAIQEHRFARICTVALVSAGLLWAFKAAAIMITGDQPPLSFELGLMLLPIGAASVFLETKTSGWLDKVGLSLAAVGLIGLVLAKLYSLVSGTQVPSSEEFVFPHSLFVLVGSIGGFTALVMLGVAFFRARYDLGHWRSMPLLVAILPLPLATTAVLHFEMPIFLIGIAWIALAYFLARIASSKVDTASNPAAPQPVG